MYLMRPRSLQAWKKDNLEISATNEVVAQYTDKLLHQFYGLYEDPNCTMLDLLNYILVEDEYNPIAHSLKAKISSDSSKILGPETIDSISSTLDALIASQTVNSKRKYTDWELDHLTAAKAYLINDDYTANSIWNRILTYHPNDILAAQFRFIDCLHAGRPDYLYDITYSSTRALRNTEYYGLALSREAFALEECNYYYRAKDLCKESLILTPWNTWAGHTMAHIFESTVQPEQGLDFYMQLSEQSNTATNLDIWTRNTKLDCHHYWHYSLFLMSTNKFEEAFEVFDNKILLKVKNSHDRFHLSDAIGFLLRVELLKCAPSRSLCSEIQNRWLEILEHILSVMEDSEEKLKTQTRFPFYDNITLLGLCVSGSKICSSNDKLNSRFKEAKQTYVENLLQGLEKLQKNFKFGDFKKENHLRLTRSIVHVAEALINDDCISIVEQLYPLRKELNNFGGSKAQCDVFHQILFYGLAGSRRLEDLERLQMLCHQQQLASDKKSWINQFMTEEFLTKSQI